MKTNTFKKLLSVATSLFFALAFVFATQTTKAFASSSITSSFLDVTLQPGEESRVGQNRVNGKITTACDIDATSGSVQYKVNALKDTTKFTMFMKEKDKMIAEKSFTGAGALDFDSREYETVTFGVKNDAQESDTFKSYLQATNSKSTKPFVCNGTSRILAPIAALIGGLLFLF